MKKIYQKPSMKVAKIAPTHALLTGSPTVTSIDGNAGIGYGGGGSGPVSAAAGTAGTTKNRSFIY